MADVPKSRYLGPNARPCEQCQDGKAERIAGYRQRWLCEVCYGKRLKIPFRDYPRLTLGIALVSLLFTSGSWWIGRQQLGIMRTPPSAGPVSVDTANSTTLDPYGPPVEGAAGKDLARVETSGSTIAAESSQPDDTRKGGSERGRRPAQSLAPPAASPVSQKDAGITEATVVVAAVPPLPARTSDLVPPPTLVPSSQAGNVQVRPPDLPEPDLTVEAFSRHAEPLLEPRLPALPPSMLPLLSGRCVVLDVLIDPEGHATALVTDAGGISAFVVERCRSDITRRWRPARSTQNEPVSDRIPVRYCWK